MQILATILTPITCYNTIYKWNVFGKLSALKLCQQSKLRSAYRYILFCSNEETLSYIKGLVTSIGPCRIRIKTQTSPLLIKWHECWAFCFSLESAGKELKISSHVRHMYWAQRVKCRALFIQVKKYKALRVVQQWSNKEDSKNVLHVWFSEVNCFISNIKWLGRNITVVKAMAILFIVHVQKENFL